MRKNRVIGALNSEALFVLDFGGRLFTSNAIMSANFFRHEQENDRKKVSLLNERLKLTLFTKCISLF